MQRKTFIMLAAPGMIGKSTAVKTACKPCSSVSVLENDCLMHEIFDTLHLPTMAISDVEEWRTRIEAIADCDSLIRLYHRDFVACHWQSSVLLAEGYLYMLHWYREQVYKGLSRLGCEFDYWLVKYNPPLSEQAERRASKYADWKWEAKPRAFHIAEIQEQWNKFEVPAKSEQVQFQDVNADQLAELISRLADSPSSR